MSESRTSSSPGEASTLAPLTLLERASQLLEHYDTVIQAVRSADIGVMDLESRESWWWLKVHAIPVARYLCRGSNGAETLLKDLEAENEGPESPPQSVS